MKILILGVTGMLGNAIFSYLSSLKSFAVFGTIRNKKLISCFKNNESKIIAEVNALNSNQLKVVINAIKPHYVINCVGAIKQREIGNNPLQAIPLNAHLPHVLSKLAYDSNSKFIQFSTDCVFSGKVGGYTENSLPDANDIYGKTKLLGEVVNNSSITLRTSIIGHELAGNTSLLDWFLSQKDSVKGYSKAIFTGLPAVEIAAVLENIFINHPNLHGLYHLSSNKISKYDLLQLIKKVYKKDINIIDSDELIIDRSLNSNLLKSKIGYIPPSWEVLIDKMYRYSGKYNNVWQSVKDERNA